MLSRVADSLYWMSRYLERAEHTARLITVNLDLTLDLSHASVDQGWARAALSLGLTPPSPADAAALAQTLVFDPSSGSSSIVACIMTARENARQVREQISSEMWEQLNRLFHELKRASLTDLASTDPIEFLAKVIEGMHLFHGVTDSTMAHGEAWRFIQVGRYMERAVDIATLLRAHFHELGARDSSIDPRDHLHWIALLKSCTAFEAYCKVYTADPKPDRIAEFLLLNPEFPHSVRYAVDRLHNGLEALPDMAWTKKSSRLTRLSGRLKAALSFSQIEEIMQSGMREYLDSIQEQCGQIHAALYQIYIHYPIESAVEA
ncbi:MAG: alpha-E domain-containing protein [Bryobacteraceae bacterium]|nr:alpha-E domain-containing protein [Bryobacteraceae bacterium]MDW8379581.1 alpha-E domain-containing protein [Bryobacterales bacterium]